MTCKTGIAKLDRLLGGGVRSGNRVLLYGPSFQGKETLARTIFLAALSRGEAAVMIILNRGVDEVRADLSAADAKYADYEKKGLPHFVDAYSRSIGIEDERKDTVYVDSATDLNAVSLALNQIHAQVIKNHDNHVLVLDSVSTIVLFGNSQATFRFLQILVGRARQAGATTFLLLDHGMHSDAEVQMFKHLADGVVMLRTEGGKSQINIEGLGLPEPPGWIDYKASDTKFEITGSLAAGRIR